MRSPCLIVNVRNKGVFYINLHTILEQNIDGILKKRVIYVNVNLYTCIFTEFGLFVSLSRANNATV